MPAGGSAGYSGTPLPKKLGLRPGQRVLFVAAPASYPALLGPLPAGAMVVAEDDAGPLDFVHWFTTSATVLAVDLPRLASRLAPAGALWISWPKKAAKVPTDVTDAVVRRLGLATGLVDVKVCAVDEIWSGLKFVRRLADRP